MHGQDSPTDDHDNHDGPLAALGAAIRSVRPGQAITVGELAEAVGLTREQLLDLEAGRLDPTYERLVSIADQLGVRLSALLALER